MVCVGVGQLVLNLVTLAFILFVFAVEYKRETFLIKWYKPAPPPSFFPLLQSKLETLLHANFAWYMFDSFSVAVFHPRISINLSDCLSKLSRF